MNEIVLDIETQDTFEQVGEYNPEKLHVSLVGVYFYATDEYRSFRENDLPKLWPYLRKASRIIGFNINNFDIPVLKRYYNGKISDFCTFDILDEIKKAIGFRLKLDSLAKANLPYSKSGNGLLAVELFKQGKWSELEKYCLDDVRITKEIYELGKRDKVLYYFDRKNAKIPIQIDFHAPREIVQKNQNLTLSF